MNEFDQSTGKASGGFANLDSQLKSIGGGMQAVGASLTAGITLPILGIGYAVVSAGSEYETALNTLQGVTQATAAEMKLAGETAKALGADVSLPATSAKDAALAMLELGKAGLTVTEAMEASKGVLQLAAAGQLEEARAAEITANALNSFSLAAADSVRVSDLLAAAANASSAGVGDIAAALQQSGASFAAAKVPIEDLTTSIATLANAGIKGSDAGTSLKTFLSSITAPSAAGAEAMKKLGVSVFDATGTFKGMPTVIGDFEKSLSGLNDEAKVGAIQKIFGADASRAAQILFKNGADGFASLKKAVTQTGAAADLAASQTKGLGGAWESLKSQLETIGIDIFNSIKEPLTNLLSFIGGLVATIGAAFSGLSPSIQLTIIAFAGIAAAIGPVLLVVGTLVASVGSIITALTAVAAFAGFATLGAAFAALTPFILPVAAAMGVVALAAVALYAAWQTNVGGIREIAAVAFEAIQTVVRGGMELIGGIMKATMLAIQGDWAGAWATLDQSVQTAMDGVVGAINNSKEPVNGAIQSMMDVIVGTINKSGPAADAGIQSLLDSFVALINAAAPAAKTAAQGLVDAVTGAVNAAAPAAGAAAQAMVNAIVADINAGFPATRAAAQRLVDGIVGGINSGAAATREAATSLMRAAAGGLNAGVNQVDGPIQAFISRIVAGINRQAASVRAAASQLATDLVNGIVNGINYNADRVRGAISNMVSGAIAAAKAKLGIQSPSKVFYAIGNDTVQGFINGVSALKGAADAAVINLLKIPADFKGFRITDKAGVELLTSLMGSLKQFYPVSKEVETATLLQTAAYQKLSPAIREAIMATAQQIDIAPRVKAGFDEISAAAEKLNESFRLPQTELEKLNALLTLNNDSQGEIARFNGVTDALTKMAAAAKLTATEFGAMLRLKAMVKDDVMPTFETGAGRGTGTGAGIGFPKGENGKPVIPELPQINLPAPPIAPWDTFWGGIKAGMSGLISQLPTLKTSLQSALIDLPSRAADIFAGSIAKFDGTLKGFFKSVAAGFGQLVKEILIEMLRIQIIKGVTKLIGSALGGLGGGGGGLTTTAGGAGVGIGGQGLNFARAGGGPVEAGKSYMVGEKEPELFVPRTSGQIYNQAQMGEMSGKTVNNTNNFNFYADPKTGAFSKESASQAAKRVGAMTADALRRA